MTAKDPKRSSFRFPLRYQISVLLIVFTAAVALLSMHFTRDFLSQDKLATVRELQTLQVAQTTQDIRQSLLIARNQFRENLSRLQNVAAGQIDLDPKNWKIISLQEKQWKSPEFPQAAWPRGAEKENPEKFQIFISPKQPADVVLLEPILLQEGASTRKVIARALVKKDFLFGDDSIFDQGFSRGVLANIANLRENSNPIQWQNHIAGGVPESRELFYNLQKYLSPEQQTALVQVSPPSSREIPTGDDNSYLFAWSSVSLPDTHVHLNLFQFIDRQTVMKGFNEFLMKQAFFAFVLLGFGVMVAQWLSGRLSRPIEGLVKAAKALEKGDFNVRVPQTRSDEIGDLGSAFNHMAFSLHEREEALKGAQAALVQNEKLAALGTLSAGIAHEVKNPLAGILGNADLALNQLKTLQLPPQNGLSRYLEIIQKETKRCRGIIDSLMRFSRQEKAEQQMIDLEVVAWEAIQLMEHSLNMSKIRVIKNFDAELQMVLGNSNQVEQILLNMLQNASHAMPDGGTITLTTRYFKEEEGAPCGNITAFQSPDFKGAFCRISIQDSGLGMSEEVQKKIFEPFFTTKPKGVGTGLGLSVTMGILGDHKARTTLTSAPGKGTTFFIDFMAKAPRDSEIHSQLEEIKHRKSGGAKVATDHLATMPAPPTPQTAQNKPAVATAGSAPNAAPAEEVEPQVRGFQMRKPRTGGTNS